LNDSESGRPAVGTSAPLIGLTTYLEQASTGVWNVPAAFLPQVYFDAITRAGGIAVLLPPQPVTAGIAARVLDALDGLVITGGKDIEPARYGQQPHPLTDAPRPDRDAWEDALLRGALERDLPFLGICRGAQVLNVTLGGTLHQHLPDLVGDTRYQAGGGVFNTADVAVQPGSRLSGLLGGATGISVPVYHHQAINTLADGLVVTGVSGPGIVQAVELPAASFAVAVQWHPEESADDLRLFAGLVAAAGRYRHVTDAIAASTPGARSSGARPSTTQSTPADTPHPERSTQP
jgi:putative glutamine amidotransferase